jgi:preprotein translocase subunit SecE
MVGEPTGKAKVVHRRATREGGPAREMATNVVSENLGEARENVSGWWNRARVFLVEVRNELKRVTWPTRTEVYAATIVVILFSIVLGTFLWVVDLILDRAVFTLFQRLGQ